MTSIHINAFQVNKYCDEQFNNLKNWVSQEKQLKYSYANRKVNSILSMAGEVSTKLMINRVFNIPYSKIIFTYNKFGKPEILNFKNIHFNISHSNNLVISCISNEEIGIDVETIKPIPNLVPNRYFSNNELALLNYQSTIAQKNYIFFKIWTMKESFIKSQGQGIFNTELRELSFVEKLNDKFVFRQVYEGYYLVHLVSNRGHLVTICSKKPVDKIIIHNFNLLKNGASEKNLILKMENKLNDSLLIRQWN